LNGNSSIIRHCQNSDCFVASRTAGCLHGNRNAKQKAALEARPFVDPVFDRVTRKLLRSRSAKVDPGFASDRAQNIENAHDLFAKPLTLWRIMR
jgi:hypothetical protein